MTSLLEVFEEHYNWHYNVVIIVCFIFRKKYISITNLFISSNCPLLIFFSNEPILLKIKNEAHRPPSMKFQTHSINLRSLKFSWTLKYKCITIYVYRKLFLDILLKRREMPMKTGTSLRIENQQLEQLDDLVNFYKDEKKDENRMNTFNVRVSRASVIEMLIRNEWNKVFMKLK
jgi:hypothetical protein